MQKAMRAASKGMHRHLLSQRIKGLLGSWRFKSKFANIEAYIETVDW